VQQARLDLSPTSPQALKKRPQDALFSWRLFAFLAAVFFLNDFYNHISNNQNSSGDNVTQRVANSTVENPLLVEQHQKGTGALLYYFFFPEGVDIHFPRV
jgi:hypothetical protein